MKYNVLLLISQKSGLKKNYHVLVAETRMGSHTGSKLHSKRPQKCDTLQKFRLARIKREIGTC